MPLDEPVEDPANNQAPDPFTRDWLFVVMLWTVPVFFLFWVVGDQGKGRAAGVCFVAVMFAGRACWNLKKHAWFWGVLAVMAVPHICVVMSVTWSSRSYPGYALLPVAMLDYGIWYGSFRLGEKLMTRNAEANPPG